MDQVFKFSRTRIHTYRPGVCRQECSCTLIAVCPVSLKTKSPSLVEVHCSSVNFLILESLHSKDLKIKQRTLCEHRQTDKKKRYEKALDY